MLPAAAAKAATGTALALARPMPLSASVAIRGAEADAPCIRALFALLFAARGGDSRTAALGVRLRAALAAG